MPQFETALRQLRKSQHQTQAKFGLMVGIPQATISKWESGRQKPSWEHLKKLADALGPLAANVLASIDAPLEGRESGQAEGFEEMQQAPLSAPNSGTVPRKRHPLFGSMKGTTIIMPGVDLTQPADPDWGKVYDDDYDHGVVTEPQKKTS
jgi:transcriptional regulator with XRE-family HTH domain